MTSVENEKLYNNERKEHLKGVKENSKNYKVLLFHAIIFILLLIFFLKICPVIPFDGDDWCFTGSLRMPFPLLFGFNPIKVFPEVLEPLGGYIAAYLVYPVTGDYVGAISITQTFIIVSFIMSLFYLFYKYIKKKYNLTENKALFFEAFFIMLFFFLFKRRDAISDYGFWANDINCYFNYVLPGILNACIVLIMARYDNFIKEFKSWTTIKKATFYIGIYFAIFSNIVISIILSAYCLWIIVKNISLNIKNKDKNKKANTSILKENIMYISIIVIWLISLMYESTGIRASIIQNDNWLTFKNAFLLLRSFRVLYKHINIYVFCFFLITMATLVIYSSNNNKKELRKELISLFCENIFIIGIVFIYLLLLFMKAGIHYPSRTDATWGLIFYLIVFYVLYMIKLSEYIPKANTILVFVFCLFSIMTVSLNYRFRQSIFNYEVAKEIDEYIINQIVEADKNGLNYVEVQVPNYVEKESNWPQPHNMAIWLQNTLYSHNIIQNRIKIVFIKNDQVYNKFYKKDYNYDEGYYDLEEGKFLK